MKLIHVGEETGVAKVAIVEQAQVEEAGAINSEQHEELRENDTNTSPQDGQGS